MGTFLVSIFTLPSSLGLLDMMGMVQQKPTKKFHKKTIQNWAKLKC